MNLKKAFAAFSEALKDDEAGTDQSFGEAVLADGTIIKWSGELVEGVAVMKVSDAGEELSLEDGTFVLEDGRSIEVRGGLVAALVAIEEEMENEFDSEAFKAEISAMIDEKLAALGFATTESVETMGAKLAEQVQVMAEQVLEAFDKQGQPKPTKEVKSESVDDRTAKAIKMATLLKKSNN
jgi:hypothetical protein